MTFKGIIDNLMSALNERERNVLAKRYRLAENQEERATLEEIGGEYQITRERVRQIENEGIKKVNEKVKSENFQILKDLIKSIELLQEKHGGFISQKHLSSNVLKTDSRLESASLEFLLNKILAKKFKTFEADNLDTIWHNDNIDQKTVISLGQAVKKLIDQTEKPLKLEDIIITCQGDICYAQIDAIKGENHFIIEALLHARTDLKKNILNQWGDASWPTVTPKRMTDKAYLVMLREGRPLHFEETAELINTSNFDRKKACAATVHNELIMDKKYVLVGRGIYALRDWGYQAGTVGDIIAKVLKESGDLSKNDLLEQVLKQRLVQKSTVMLALMNKDRFQKNEDGKYALIK